MTFAFKIGDLVDFVTAQDVSGCVIAYMVRGKRYVTYQVSWFHNGELQSDWFEDVQLRPHAKRARGFSGG